MVNNMNEVTKDFENLVADMNYGTTNQQYSTEKKSNLLSFQVSILKFANKYCPDRIPMIMDRIISNRELIPEHYVLDDNEYKNLQDILDNLKKAFPDMSSNQVSQDIVISR